MTTHEFVDLVRDMRLEQRRYFSTRDNAALAESKRLERLVDAELERLRQEAAAKLSLFSDQVTGAGI